MKRALTALLLATALSAPVYAKPKFPADTPSMLVWSPEQQARSYRAIETVYPVATVAKGPHVRSLPQADHEIAPTVVLNGKPLTLAEYMAAYRVSGVLVLHDGVIVLERYGLGRQPADRWTSMSVAKSVTSLLAGAAIQDGKLALSDPVERYIPEFRGTAYEGVTDATPSSTTWPDSPARTRPARPSTTTPPRLTWPASSSPAPSASRSRPTSRKRSGSPTAWSATPSG